MKGKDCFTETEVSSIRNLLKRKVGADSNCQKIIRGRLRTNYNFYISDFTDRKLGFTVNDFDELMASGRISVVSRNT